MTELYYLKSTIKAEPLIWQWYAWSHLISPATAGCNIVDRHIKIMKSYIQSPQFHKEAMNNTQLLGGPFIDLEGQSVKEVEDLLATTEQQCAELIALAASLKEFDALLQSSTEGGSLEALYARVPDNLKGLIELVYDLNHHPSMRLIEPLFYQKYYSNKHQMIALSAFENDNRKFIMSTPRLQSKNEIYIKFPFSDAVYNDLFSMRHTGKGYEEIKQKLNISPNDEQLFKSFFTQTPPILSDDRHYHGEGIRVRYLGHACVLLQTKEVTILTDPVLSYPSEGCADRYTMNDLPDQIDYVILTHNHQDHVLFETLLQLRHKIKHVIFPNNQKGALADPSLKLILKQLGFRGLIGLDEFEHLPLPHGEIIGLPFLGEHADLNVQTKMAYYVKLKGKGFIFAADSNNLEPKLYEHIFAYTGPIDILFLGMECDGAPLSWLYGPLLTKPMKRSHDNARSLSGSNFEKAWPIVTLSQCKKAYVYAMGQEPWLNYIMALKYTPESLQITESNRFVEACQALGLESARLYGKKEWII